MTDDEGNGVTAISRRRRTSRGTEPMAAFLNDHFPLPDRRHVHSALSALLARQGADAVILSAGAGEADRLDCRLLRHDGKPRLSAPLPDRKSRAALLRFLLRLPDIWPSYARPSRLSLIGDGHHIGFFPDYPDLSALAASADLLALPGPLMLITPEGAVRCEARLTLFLPTRPGDMMIQ